MKRQKVIEIAHAEEAGLIPDTSKNLLIVMMPLIIYLKRKMKKDHNFLGFPEYSLW